MTDSAPPTIRFLDLRGSAMPLDPLRPFEPTVTLATTFAQFDEAGFARAGALFAERSDVKLRVHRSECPDLKFLRHFKGLRRLSIAILDLGSMQGIETLRDSLESLDIERTRKSLDFGFLRDLPRLRELSLEAHRKAARILGELTGLTSLSLRSFPLPDLTLLKPLTDLTKLSILLGGGCDLRLLPHFERLEALYLLRVAGLADLSMLRSVAGLRRLDLDGLPHVLTLPGFAPLRQLETVTLEGLKGLTDLAPIAAATALRELEIVTMPQLKAADFAPFLGHPTLRHLRAFPGGARVRDEIRRLFPGVAA